MADQHILTNLKATKTSFDLIEWEKFYRRNFGDASLVSYESAILGFKKNLSEAIELAPDVSTDTLRKFQEIASIIVSNINIISNLTNENYLTKRHPHIEHIEHGLEELKSIWPEFRGLIVEKLLNDKSRIEEIERAQANLNDLAFQLSEQKEKSSKDSDTIHNLRLQLESELNNIESRIKETVTKGEFLVQQDIFKKQAERHKSISNRWLFGIAGAALLLVGVIFFIFHNFCFETKCLCIYKLSTYNSVCADCGQQILIFEMIKSIVFRLFIVSTTLFLLIFCIKNYNAQMHNFTINSHKENAFAAAFSLLSKAKTDEGNDKLMIEAAQSIFSHQKTGYGGKENEVQNLNALSSILDKLNSK